MKILLSAYACEPNKGSEPGVGWNWAMELAKLDHEVWVLTRKNNQPAIEAEFQKRKQPDNLHFIYYDCQHWIKRFKRGRQGIHFYYLLWQWGAYKKAKKIHVAHHFDLVHHVTFVTVRQPSFMGNLGIPFIFGPVGGGEKAPWRLRFHYGFRGFWLDALRDLANFIVRIDPLMWHTFAKAKKIYVTSEQSKQIVPSCYHRKTTIQMAIGIEQILENKKLETKRHDHDFRVLYVGQFLYWKGMGVGLRAFAKLVEQVPDARLTMVGRGPEEKRWKELTIKLKIADKVEWIPWVAQSELSQIFQQHDVLLFPSLHDSGGLVVLESMAHGLPVVCLDLGGPGEIVDENCGGIAQTKGVTFETLTNQISQLLIRLTKDPSLRQILRQKAVKHASKHRWGHIVRYVYG